MLSSRCATPSNVFNILFFTVVFIHDMESWCVGENKGWRKLKTLFRERLMANERADAETVVIESMASLPSPGWFWQVLLPCRPRVCYVVTIADKDRPLRHIGAWSLLSGLLCSRHDHLDVAFDRATNLLYRYRRHLADSCFVAVPAPGRYDVRLQRRAGGDAGRREHDVDRSVAQYESFGTATSLTTTSENARAYGNCACVSACACLNPHAQSGLVGDEDGYDDDVSDGKRHDYGSGAHHGPESDCVRKSRFERGFYQQRNCDYGNEVSTLAQTLTNIHHGNIQMDDVAVVSTNGRGNMLSVPEAMANGFSRQASETASETPLVQNETETLVRNVSGQGYVVLRYDPPMGRLGSDALQWDREDVQRLAEFVNTCWTRDADGRSSFGE